MSVLRIYVENFVITFNQMKYAILGWGRHKSGQRYFAAEYSAGEVNPHYN